MLFGKKHRCFPTHGMAEQIKLFQTQRKQVIGHGMIGKFLIVRGAAMIALIDQVNGKMIFQLFRYTGPIVSLSEKAMKNYQIRTFA
jgi:hypothetical protein